MHGYLRFGLAILVVLSHLDHAGGLNVGVSAVVVFYLLAGYVVTNLIHKHFGSGRLLSFYAERFLRIYPLYFTFLAMVFAFLFITRFGSPIITPLKILAQVTIIPLNFFMFFHTAVVRNYCVLPPAWSLGAELQAYLFLPLIIRSTKAKWIVGFLSLVLFSVAAIGECDRDIWGYRLLPGILFIFLSGSALAKSIKHKKSTDSFDRSFPIICWIWLLGLLLALTTMTHRLYPLTAAVILGFVIGLPVVHFTSSTPVRLFKDGLVGSLSYGLFLIHLPVAWAFEYWFGRAPVTIGPICVVFVASVILSLITSQTVERLVWPLREAITKERPVTHVPKPEVEYATPIKK